MVRILTPFMATWLDYPDNESIAISVCMMGCDNGCPFCQNPQFQSPDYKESTKEYTVESLIEELAILCKRNMTDKVVLTGGDPLSCFNIEFTKEFLEKSPFQVCVYSGHSVEYCKFKEVRGFNYLKCGMFLNNEKRESLKTDEYVQFASPNQQLYNGEYCLLSENGIYYFKN